MLYNVFGLIKAVIIDETVVSYLSFVSGLNPSHSFPPLFLYSFITVESCRWQTEHGAFRGPCTRDPHSYPNTHLCLCSSCQDCQANRLNTKLLRQNVHREGFSLLFSLGKYNCLCSKFTFSLAFCSFSKAASGIFLQNLSNSNFLNTFYINNYLYIFLVILSTSCNKLAIVPRDIVSLNWKGTMDESFSTHPV